MRRASFFLPQPRQLFWLFWPTLEALGWASVICTYVNWRGVMWAKLGGALERAGEISYSLYLWHGLVVYLVSKLVDGRNLTGNAFLNTAVAGLLVLLLSWWVAAMSYRTIELPFLGLRRRYVGSGGAPAHTQ